jgi:hypothetical protein
MDAITTKLIRMRHPQEDFQVTPVDRLRNGEEELNIVRAYDPDGRRTELFVEVRELANG